MKIQDYKTVFGDTSFELDHFVQKLIKDGYQPFGSPYFIGATKGNDHVQVCQAMIRYGPVSHAAAGDKAS